MKKKMCVVLMVVISVFMFSGCLKEERDNEVSTTPKESVEIYMFISSPEYADAMETLIEEYELVNPNVTINYETTQNDYPTLLKTKLNSGKMPDIFSSTSGKEIDVYLDYSQDLSGQPLSEVMNDSVKSVMMSGDEVHGMSIKDNLFGIVYNKGIFEKVGISAFPQTFSELEVACEKLEAAGYTPFSSGFAEWWVYKHIFQHYMYAAQPDDVEGLVKKFINGEVAFEDYPELYDDFFNFIDLVSEYGDDKLLESDLSTEIATLGSEQAAMIIGQGAWVEIDVLKINPEIKIGFDGYPINEEVEKTKIIAGSDQAIRIYKESEVLPEVLEFVNWWYTSDYGKSWFSEVAGVLPPVKEAVLPEYEIVQQGNVHINEEGAGTLGIAYSTDSFHQAFGEIMQAYVGGVITKDEACVQIETKWVELEGNN